MRKLTKFTNTNYYKIILFTKFKYLYCGGQKVYIAFHIEDSLLNKDYFLELIQRRLIK